MFFFTLLAKAHFGLATNNIQTYVQKDVSEYLNEIFSTFGLPKKIQSDNGPPFNIKKISEYLEQRIIEHKRITPY